MKISLCPSALAAGAQCSPIALFKLRALLEGNPHVTLIFSGKGKPA
jgi:hypothetical protein